MTETPIPKRYSAVGVIALCFAVTFLEGFDIQSIGVAAPRLIPALGLSQQQAGLAFGGGMLGLVLGALGGGWLSDRVGRKMLLVGSVLTFGLFTLLTMIASDFTVLLVARLGTGLGLGVAMPVLVAIALEVSEPAKRARTITTMFCGMPAGGATAALYAALTFETLDWRGIFLVGGLAPLLLTPFLLRLPQTRKDTAAAAAAAHQRGVGGLFGEGRALTTLLLWSAFGLTLLVLYLLLNWLPSLVTARGLSRLVGSQAAMAFNLGSVVGALVIGRLVDRFGARLPIAIAYAGLLAAMLGLSQANAALPVLACSAAAGFCLLGAQYSLYGVAPMYYPAASRGLATGAAVAVGRLGSILGPLVAGQLLTAGFSAAGVAMAMAPVVIVAGLAATMMTTRATPFAD